MYGSHLRNKPETTKVIPDHAISSSPAIVLLEHVVELRIYCKKLVFDEILTLGYVPDYAFSGEGSLEAGGSLAIENAKAYGLAR
jgi:hypothetical protein